MSEEDNNFDDNFDEEFDEEENNEFGNEDESAKLYPTQDLHKVELLYIELIPMFSLIFILTNLYLQQFDCRRAKHYDRISVKSVRLDAYAPYARLLSDSCGTYNKQEIVYRHRILILRTERTYLEVANPTLVIR
jgi:hypothetical protein